MEKKLLNLTLSVVLNKLENILTTYPQYPYQEAFSATGLHQDLVAYVLNRVPNKFTVLEEQEELSKPNLLLLYPSQDLLDMEFFIHLGICELLHSYKRINCDIGQPYSLTCAVPFREN